MQNNQTYTPRPCAFHPKELIFNFCKNPDCLLPLCPSCVKVHSEEHKLEGSYGQFQNMEKLVDNLQTFFKDISKELQGCTQQINQGSTIRTKNQQDIRRRMVQAKNKMMGLVERFFLDFEKQVSKSIISYNQSMNQNYGKIKLQIKQLQQDINSKRNTLGTDKVLKTIISYYSKNDEEKIKNNIEELKNKIIELQQRKVDVVCQQSSAQRIIDELGQYIHLQFQNWQQQIKYVAQFVKTGFTEKSSQKIIHSNTTEHL